MVARNCIVGKVEPRRPDVAGATGPLDALGGKSGLGPRATTEITHQAKRGFALSNCGSKR